MNESLQIDKAQSETVFKFLECLFSDNVESYWNTISKVDQSRVYGMYKVAKLKEAYQQSFFEYVRDHFQKKQQEVYKRLKERSPGIATHVRYTDCGEVMLYLLEDVQVPRIYIAETQVVVFPVVLTMDVDLQGQDVNLSWKVRLYEDQDYKNINV